MVAHTGNLNIWEFKARLDYVMSSLSAGYGVGPNRYGNTPLLPNPTNDKVKGDLVLTSDTSTAHQSTD